MDSWMSVSSMSVEVLNYLSIEDIAMLDLGLNNKGLREMFLNSLRDFTYIHILDILESLDRMKWIHLRHMSASNVVLSLPKYFYEHVEFKRTYYSLCSKMQCFPLPVPFNYDMVYSYYNLLFSTFIKLAANVKVSKICFICDVVNSGDQFIQIIYSLFDGIMNHLTQKSITCVDIKPINQRYMDEYLNCQEISTELAPNCCVEEIKFVGDDDYGLRIENIIIKTIKRFPKKLSGTNKRFCLYSENWQLLKLEEFYFEDSILQVITYLDEDTDEKIGLAETLHFSPETVKVTFNNVLTDFDDDNFYDEVFVLSLCVCAQCNVTILNENPEVRFEIIRH